MAVLGLHCCEEDSQQRFCPRTANTASGGFLLSSKPTSLFILCLYFSKGNPLSDLLILCSPPPPPNTHTHTHTGTHWSWYSGASHCPLMELNFPPCLTLLPAVTLGGASRCARRRSGLTPVHCRSWVCCAWQWVLGVAAASVAAPGTELLGTGPHRGCLLVPESRTCPWLWREQWEPLRRSKHRNSISPNSHGWWGPARFVWQ